MQNITSNNNTKTTILILEKWNVYRVRLVDSRKKHSREKKGEGGQELSKGLLALFYRVRCRAATGLSGTRFETVVSRRKWFAYLKSLQWQFAANLLFCKFSLYSSIL